MGTQQIMIQTCSVYSGVTLADRYYFWWLQLISESGQSRIVSKQHIFGNQNPRNPKKFWKAVKYLKQHKSYPFPW